MLEQTDLENYSTIDLIAKLQLHQVMQTNVTDRVIKDTWNSRVDVSGSVFENSTAYNYLYYNYSSSKEDFESKRRFYHNRDLEVDVRPHKFSYRVWLQSMSLRYFIEMTFFAINVFIFQYYLSSFNKDLHIVNKDIQELVDMGIYEKTADGRILAKDERELSGITTGGSYTDAASFRLHIEEVKAELAHEIDLSVWELEEVMIVGMISFSFPFQFLMSYIYSHFTGRNFKVRSTSIIDLIIVLCVGVWFEKFEEYIYADNDGFRLEENPTTYHKFMQALLNDINTGEFHFDWLLAATAFLFWIRLIFMLQLTHTFGPLIRTTVAMMSDLVIFFLLFTI